MAERRPAASNRPSGISRNAAVVRAAEKNRQANNAVNRGQKKGAGFLNICLAVVATIFFGLVALAVYSQTSYVKKAWSERASLLEIAESHEVNTTSSKQITAPLEPSVPYISAFDMEMRDINPDYVCWIKIDDTIVDYPVVRGEDNDKYLNQSFYGERNSLGTLFMDYRCDGDYVPHIIIYGHNSSGGAMFGGLRRFLNERFLDEHPVITLRVNDRIVEYEIFSARTTNVNDPAYFLDFSAPGSFDAFAERCGAPQGAAQIITLSTCVSGYDRDERVVVQGFLR